MKRFLFYSQRTAQYNAEVLPAHFEYLAKLRAAGKIELSGGFADLSGGAVIIRAESLEEAQAIAANDPISKQGTHLLKVYEWKAE
ncbi:MAG TPA: YciI family protein [Symbiobacteriaceae bacterium]|nr:YciI family protein [Symbiobacteriaceae bacterium]